MRMLLLALLLVPACSSTASDLVHERWVQTNVSGLGLHSTFQVVATTIDSEGFPVRHADVTSGGFETEWVYGSTRTAMHGPSRRRVIASLEADEAGGWLLRLRVKEQAIRKGNMLATQRQLEASEDWEDVADDVESAEVILHKIRVLLAGATGTPR